MATTTKQRRKYCRDCRTKTLHVATIQTTDLGCGFVLLNLFMSIITLGLWIPIAVLIFGLGVFGNALAPMGAKYLCQQCGRRN